MISTDKVKSFILHNEGPVRSFAVEFFAKGYFQGWDKTEIMPLVLEACDRYVEQEKDNRLTLSYAKELPQTSETIIEILQRLKRKKEINFWYEQILCHADPNLVTSYLPEIKRLLSKKGNQTIQYRQQFLQSTTQTLWDELIKFGDQAAGKYINEFDYLYGEFLAWELARRGDLSSDTVLRQFFTYDLEGYTGYNNIYLANIIGKRGLVKAVRSLLNWLSGEGDLDNEKAEVALTKIGSKAVISAIKDRFFEENDAFRLYASGVLANIKGKDSEQAILELLEQEKEDLTIITVLADGLCKQLSIDGIPVVKKYIDEDYYDRGMMSLEEELYKTCIITGVELPELPKWKGKMEDMDWGSSRQRNSKVPPFGLSDTMLQSSRSTIVKTEKIGRNDPCPCGSGKKYKKCCG